MISVLCKLFFPRKIKSVKLVKNICSAIPFISAFLQCSIIWIHMNMWIWFIYHSLSRYIGRSSDFFFFSITNNAVYTCEHVCCVLWLFLRYTLGAEWLAHCLLTCLIYYLLQSAPKVYLHWELHSQINMAAVPQSHQHLILCFLSPVGISLKTHLTLIWICDSMTTNVIQQLIISFKNELLMFRFLYIIVYRFCLF